MEPITGPAPLMGDSDDHELFSPELVDKTEWEPSDQHAPGPLQVRAPLFRIAEPEWEHWLLARRNLEDPSDVAP